MPQVDIAQLAEDVEAIKALLNTLGIELHWTSPSKAEALLGVSRGYILKEIRAAEEKRILRRKTDLKYGRHYRRVGSDWQINLKQFKKIVLETPPEERA